jgi:D-lactate dehydrogenase
MRVAVFSTKSYDQRFLRAANAAYGHEFVFLEPRLMPDASALIRGFPAVCVFMNDQLGAPVLQVLAQQRTSLIALRSAGFNHVNLAAAQKLGLTVVRVSAYSPSAVAEHTVGLMLTLNRKLHHAYARGKLGRWAWMCTRRRRQACSSRICLIR